MANLEQEALSILDRAVQEFRPSHVFGLFSGGYDSVCATDIASRHPAFSGAVHINTGIGIEETREYVRRVSSERGWNLLELHPTEKTYDELVLRHGFPGPSQHNKMYRYLKERAIRKLLREHKTHWHDRILLVSGVRRQESARRMGHIEGEWWKDDAKVWVNPILNWAATDRWPYMKQRGIPRNRVVDLLHMSGECLCGAFAKPGELSEIALWFPQAAQRIHDLEAQCQTAGVPCVWGTRPNGQPAKASNNPLCFGCDERVEQTNQLWEAANG